MKKLMFALVIMFIIACSKEDKIVETKQTITFNRSEFVGENGGQTVYGSSTAAKGEDGVFISQYPLIEYKYEQSVQYDSVATYTINESTLDTLSVDWEVFEVSRDTVGFSKGVIWMPILEINRTEMYIGVGEQFINDTEIEISIDIDGGYGGQSDGFLFALCTSNGVCVVDNDKIPLTEPDYTIVDDVPVYDEFGNVIAQTTGFRLNDFLIRYLKSNSDVETKSFTLNVETSNGSSVSNQFDIKFVPLQQWQDRQCWLDSEPECIDLFNE